MTDEAREQHEPTDAIAGAVDPMVTGRAPQAAMRVDAHRSDTSGRPRADRETVFHVDKVTVKYDGIPAVRDIEFDVRANEIAALIGPSGCGKSTLIRCLNRMNDLILTASVEGSVYYHGQDLYGERVDPVEVRKLIGMVFQKPNPFPKSIYDNIAFGPRVIGMKGSMDEIVERALRRAALWDEVKDRLKANAYGMSGGQQQRLCIARCLAVEPDVILMDEPCSALDPISTGRIEDLMLELKQSYSIVIVTHNMQQAARVSDLTAFFTVELDEGILSLFALQAPVASDLRVVAALLHVIKHVERMGDQCVNIAKVLPLTGHEPPSDEAMLERIMKMGALARSQVAQVKQAFLLRDVALAEDLVRQDEKINCLNREVFRLAVEIGTDEDRREWAMTMMLVSRALERIGDNAVDIGEQVAFVVTGLFREFSDASRV